MGIVILDIIKSERIINEGRSNFKEKEINDNIRKVIR